MERPSYTPFTSTRTATRDSAIDLVRYERDFEEFVLSNPLLLEPEHAKFIDVLHSFGLVILGMQRSAIMQREKELARMVTENIGRLPLKESISNPKISASAASSRKTKPHAN
jgi:hypothetical protein